MENPQIKAATLYQKQFWYEWLIDPESTKHNTFFYFSIKGNLNIVYLEQALAHFFQQHELSRCYLFDENDSLKLHVLQNITFNLDVQSVISSVNKEAIQHEFINNIINYQFDLRKAPLFKCGLVQYNENEYYCAICVHHIISDAFSGLSLINQVSEYYNQLSNNMPLVLQPSLISLDKYHLYEQQYYSDKTLALKYWLNLLNNTPLSVKFPVQINKSIAKDQGEFVHFKINQALVKHLKRCCRQLKTSPFLILSTLFGIILNKYTRQSELIIAYPVNMRPPRLTSLLGCFVNITLLKINIKSDASFQSILEDLTKQRKTSRNYQYLPFIELISKLRSEGKIQDDNFFNVSVVEQNINNIQFQFDNIQVIPQPIKNNTTNYDLCFEYESGEAYLGRINYRTRLFNPEIIDLFVTDFLNVLEFSILNPLVNVKQLQLAARDTLHPIVKKESPINIDLMAIIAEHALLHPNAVALIHSKNTITYKILNILINNFCDYLYDHNVKANSVVAVSLSDSLSQIVVMLALFRIGGIYLPLDPEFPESRIKYMLLDSSAEFIVQDKNNINFITKIPYIFDPKEKNIHHKRIDTLQNKSPAVIFYTSGSTGKPKGILSSRIGIANYINNIADIYQFTPKDRGLQFASCGFDASLEEVLLPLTRGASLVLKSKDNYESFSQLIAYCNLKQVTVLTLPTSYWSALTDYMQSSPNNFFTTIRMINISGEKLTFPSVQKWQNNPANKEIKIYNVYGTTETTIAATVHEIKYSNFYINEIIPIGLPINNVYAYVLDEDMQPVPRGLIGELYLGGLGVALGYVNNSVLTEERFVADPYCQNTTMYKTGDLACWNSLSELEIVGRSDSQIKVRGMLINPNEIMHTLEMNHDISKAVVINYLPWQDRNPLVAYVLINHTHKKLNEQELKTFLQQYLPAYMIPHRIIFVKEFLLNHNHKIDMSALPLPESFPINHEFIPAQNDIEFQVQTIWQEIFKQENISCNHEFLELGGNSLLAMQVVSRIESKFNCKIPVKKMFEFASIQSLAKLIVNNIRTDLHHVDFTPAIPEQDGGYTISYAQQRLWYIDQLHPHNNAYNILEVFHLQGEINLARLGLSFQAMIDRHEILRTSFDSKTATLRQYIEDKKNFKLSFCDLSNNLTVMSTYQLDNIILELVNQPFNLKEPELIRAKLIKISSNKALLVIVMHHIIIDAWSFELFMQELAEIYNNYNSKNFSFAINNKPIWQYKDYAAWNQRYLSKEYLSQQLDYWKSKLPDKIDVLQLPTDKPRPINQTFNGALYKFEIKNTLLNKLQKICQQENSTLFSIFLTVYRILLHRYSRQRTIPIGIPVAGRALPEIENMLGFFVNTWVFVSHYTEDQSFLQLWDNTKGLVLEALDYQHLPIEILIQDLQIERHAAYNPLFQTMFTFQNSNIKKISFSGIETSYYEFPHHTAKFDLLLFLWEQEDSVLAAFEYNTDLFTEQTMVRYAKHYLNLLEHVIDTINQSISKVSLFDDSEFNKLIIELNQSPHHYKCIKSFNELFVEQCLKTPNRIAVSCEKDSLTYQTLNDQANQVAAILIKNNLQKEQRIVLLQEREINYLVSLIATLKAGGAFVPLDTAYSDERIALIVEQSNAAIIITDKHLYERALLLSNSAKIICIDDVLSETQTISAINGVDSLANLAYVIYTSGSTGNPKGVMIEHLGMINHLYAKIYDLEITENDVVAEIAVQTFDVSIWQFLAALLVGGKTCIFKGETAWHADLLLQHINKEKVTIIESVPSHTKVILDEIEFSQKSYDISSLRWYMCNAEPLTAALCERWFKFNPTVPIINAYGSTETSDDSSHYKIFPSIKINQQCLPVNGALPNLFTYILDEYLNPVPIGTIGEIYIGGDGVGRGYLNNPEATAKSYLVDSIRNISGARLYKSGDLAKYCADYSIELVGRSDFQVKIRGLRVDTREIEYNILEHINVKEILVISEINSQNETYLIAYIVSKIYPAPTSQELSRFCQNRLSPYMIPAIFITIDRFPLSNNGKIARNLLPNPANELKRITYNYEPARNDLQKQIIFIWQKTLSKDKIGIYDNFFDLGGHSLVAAETIIKLKAQLNIELPLKYLFDYPILEKFAEMISTLIVNNKNKGIDNSLKLALDAVKSYPKQVFYPLAPCQVAEWFAFKLYPDSSVYNVSINGVFFTGILKLSAFVEAWQIIIDRHIVFKARFSYKNNAPIQIFDREIILTEDDIFIDKRHLTPDDMIKETNIIAKNYSEIPFDLENEPLFRLKLVGFPDQQYQLVFVVHHIIWDETSSINLIRELSLIYNQLIHGQKVELPKLKLSYPDYIQWINKSIDEGLLENQRQYWLNLYNNMPPILNLPTDYPRPTVITYAGNAVDVWMPREISRKLSDFKKNKKVTLFALMLSVIQLYIYRITSQKDFVIGCPIAGRDHEDFKPLLGLFATPMPIRSYITEKMSFNDLLMTVMDKLLDAFQNHYYPCNMVIEELEYNKDLSRPRLFSIMYGVQNNKTELLDNLHFTNLKVDIKKINEAELNSARFDLTFVVDEYGSDIMLTCIYNTRLYKHETIERMVNNLLHLASSVTDKGDDELSSFQIMTYAEKERCLYQNNNINIDTKNHLNASCLKLFENQVNLSPNRVAITTVDANYTYSDLNKYANQIARYLLSVGCKAHTIIAVAIRPSFALTAALYAIFKIRACYIAIHSDFPQKRINLLVNDSEVKYVLTDRNNEGFHVESILHIVDVISEQSTILSYDDTNLNLEYSDKDLAYIVYTSGTTGKPKGIQICQQGITNLLYSTQNEYQLNSDDKLLQLTPISFDASILDVFWPLAYGASLLIPKQDICKTPAFILNTINNERVTLFQTVPSMLDALCDQNMAAPSLRLIICGGAPLPKITLDKFRRSIKCQLANHYGPSEITVDATRFDCNQSFIGNIVPIGKPIDNVAIYILDDNLKLLPLGCIGEICISSPGLALGYLHDQNLTTKKFLTVQLDDQYASCIYRSGDLGKRMSDGNIYYIGRKDKQIKYLGNRIELEEIDSSLGEHPSIKAVVTRFISSENSINDKLLAYIELHPYFNALKSQNENYYLYTLNQNPVLIKAMNAAHIQAWPTYFSGNDASKQYWPELAKDFSDYQLGLVTERGELAAVGNSIPFYWDGQLASLPEGWDDGFARAIEFNQRNDKPANTLLVLAGISDSAFREKGLSDLILKAFKMLAKAYGFTKIIVPVRPTAKALHPEIDFNAWCCKRREDGQLCDPWLRIHERVGGKLLKTASRSQKIVGTPSDWNQWLGLTLEHSGEYVMPGTLQNAQVDLSQDTIEYFDPSVWFEHESMIDSVWHSLTKIELRRFLENRLPSYMIPQQYYFIPKLILTETGKIDENRLPSVVMHLDEIHFAAKTKLQKELAEIWIKLLSLDKVGITDDFFDLGGQSLKLVQLLGIIHVQCNVKISLAAFYSNPTIQGVEKLILNN